MKSFLTRSKMGCPPDSEGRETSFSLRGAILHAGPRDSGRNHWMNLVDTHKKGIKKRGPRWPLPGYRLPTWSHVLPSKSRGRSCMRMKLRWPKRASETAARPMPPLFLGITRLGIPYGSFLLPPSEEATFFGLLLFSIFTRCPHSFPSFLGKLVSG